MTQHPFPMFVTPHEAGASPAANSYSAYLLGHHPAGRTPARDRGEPPVAVEAGDVPPGEDAAPAD
ncbi:MULTISPECIES: hypothetical protein [unclassified Nonomuraea]|uniref:hypothetical protein n=1 Tax=unclassified Nonomuraea TaxID=2593643 RepID=UPI0033C43685